MFHIAKLSHGICTRGKNFIGIENLNLHFGRNIITNVHNFFLFLVRNRRSRNCMFVLYANINGFASKIVRIDRAKLL